MRNRTAWLIVILFVVLVCGLSQARSRYGDNEPTNIIIKSFITYDITITVPTPSDNDCIQGGNVSVSACHSYANYENQVVGSSGLFIDHISFYIVNTVVIDKSNCEFWLEWGIDSSSVHGFETQLLLMGDGTSLESQYDKVVISTKQFIPPNYWWHIRVEETIAGECDEIKALTTDVIGHFGR